MAVPTDRAARAGRDHLVTRARQAWAQQAGVPVDSFTSAGVHPVVRPASAIAPPGWVGVVAIGGAALTTVPDTATAAAVRHVLNDLPVDRVVEDSGWYSGLNVRAVLGPAWLSYGEGQDVITRGHPHQVEFVPPGDPSLRGLLERVAPEEASEATLAEVTSRVAVIRGSAGVVAAAGFQHWAASTSDGAPGATSGGTTGGTAHLCVLTAPEVRGQHLAPAVASAAAAEAGRLGLLLQWRARPRPSRRVAAHIGLLELGWQLSLDCRP